MTDTPISDAMKADGTWNPDWDSAAELGATWMEKFLDVSTQPLRDDVLDPKTYELIAIAVDASCTHLYAPGTRRHIGRALQLGVSPDEILAVLQAVASLGIHSIALGAPILAEEMNRRGMTRGCPPNPENSHAIS